MLSDLEGDLVDVQTTRENKAPGYAPGQPHGKPGPHEIYMAKLYMAVPYGLKCFKVGSKLPLYALFPSTISSVQSEEK